MSLMWIPAETTVPPGAIARSASTISSPTGAKTIAASRSDAAGSPTAPAHSAPSERASSWVSVSPSRVSA